MQEIMGHRREVADGVVGVRVVHDHGERLAQIEPLEAAGDVSDLVRSFGDGVRFHVARVSSGGGGHQVVHVDPAQHRAPDGNLALRRNQLEANPVAADFQVLGVKVAAIDAVRNHFVVLLAERQQALAVLVFDVDDHEPRRLHSQSLKQNGLRLEVALHRAVIVEMIARQVGEHRHFERNPENPLLLQSVRRNFQHRLGASDVHRLGEDLVQFESFGRGVGSGKGLVSDAVLDRADQRDLAPRGPQHPAQDERRRGLAVGAGDSGDRQLLGRMAVEVGAEPGQCPPAMRHHRPGNPFARRNRVAHHGHRSVGDRLVDITVAVGAFAAHGDETPSGLHPPAVVIQPGNGRIAAFVQIFRTIKQL